MTNYITYDEAAQILGVSHESIRIYVQKGVLVQGESHGYRKVLRSSVTALMQHDVVEQTKAIEDLRRELIKEKAYLLSQKREVALKKDLLMYKDKIFGSYVEICNFLITFIDNTDSLTFREKDVAHKLLRGTTLDEIAETIGLTRERVRQIWNKALRKFAYNKKLPELKAENEVLKAENESQAKVIESLKTMIKNQDHLEQLETNIYLPKSLVGLKNSMLSVRSYNVLKHAGFVNLYQLVFIPRVKLRKFRNLGKKSLQEIDSLLEDYGLWYDSPETLKEVKMPNKESVVAIPKCQIEEERQSTIMMMR